MIYRSLFAAVFLAVAAFILWGAASAFEVAQERQITYRYISSALTPAPERDTLVTWEEPVQTLVRPFTESDAKLIGQALVEAWQILAVSQESGTTDILADRFTGVAAKRAEQSVSDATQYGGRMIVLQQKASPVFFHKDGSLFQAEVEMLVARHLSKNGEDLDAFTISRETGVATLMNESNGWRVFSYERRSSSELSADKVPWSGFLQGLNYYPAETPWRDFWPRFDPALVWTDFSLIKGLGANSVRVFLTRDAFIGKSAEDAEKNLESLLKIAKAKGLTVVPTLFDLKQDFSLGTWADDARYLERVLPILSNSPAVSFIDLKNEPDLDFKHHGKAKMTAWLKTMIALSRLYAIDKSLTIGWSAADAAPLLAGEIDVITYHDYAPIDGTYDRLAVVESQVNGAPILITEIGDSTFEVTLGYPGSEGQQAERLGNRLDALKSSDGVFVWTLHDFPKVDGTVVGSSPWVKRLQSKFGLLRADGSEKPAALTLRNSFSDG